MAIQGRRRLPRIEVGYHAFLRGSEEEFGAVREVSERALVVNVEGAGDFTLDLGTVEDVVEEKVIVDPARLDPKLREAIRHAHEQEDYPPADEHPAPGSGVA